MSSEQFIEATIIQEIPFDIDSDHWEELPNHNQARLLEIWDYIKSQLKPLPYTNSYSNNETYIVFCKRRKDSKKISNHLYLTYKAQKLKDIGCDFILRLNW